jgi:hypothetical protein
LLVSALLSLAGHVLMWAGAYVGRLWLMLLGRFLYGCGGEALSVTHATLLVAWFSASALRKAFAVSQVAMRVVSLAHRCTDRERERGVCTCTHRDGEREGDECPYKERKRALCMYIHRHGEREGERDAPTQAVLLIGHGVWYVGQGSALVLNLMPLAGTSLGLSNSLLAGAPCLQSHIESNSVYVCIRERERETERNTLHWRKGAG